VLKKSHPLISGKRLRELLSYDPETGLWEWIVPRPGSRKSREAGTLNKVDGYRRIMIDGRLYLAHVLAWFWMTGEWPEDEVDHRDTDRANTRWENLRDATHAQNQWNANKRQDNTSGFKGVSYHRPSGKWWARLGVNGKRHSLGLHDTREAAHAAVVRAGEEFHGEFLRAA
jgi:hypothetical protein